MSRFQGRLLTEFDAAGWHRLWAGCGGALALHWEWPAVAALGVGRPVRVGVFSPGDHLVAGAVFVERRHRMFRHWLHPAPAPFGGVLVAEPLRESFAREVLSAMSACVCESVPRAELIPAREQQDLRALVWNGWSVRPHYNYVHCIEEEDTLERVCENAVRRQGARARESGLKIETGPHLLDEVLKLWEDTRQRQGLAAYVHPDCYRALAADDAALRRDGIDVVVSVVRGSSGEGAMAGALHAADQSRVYYLLGASRPGKEAGGEGAPTLLHFEITKEFFKKRGPFLYDWVGANTPSIAQFKKKFRPELEINFRAFATRGLARFVWG